MSPTGERREVALPTGKLEIEVLGADLPFEQLCGFAARRNPRRGFLFVSRVLGRYLPVRPALLRDAQRRLAARIPHDLPGPVVILGIAESAIALAQGVHELWARATGREDVLFLHTTRHRLDAPIAVQFEEEHSHASRHFVYTPVDPAVRQLFANARSLVIVDDEATTGTTFVNLVRELARPGLERILCVTLTDWAAPFGERMPSQTERISLLHGVCRFSPVAGSGAVAMPNAASDDTPKDRLFSKNRGRVGLREAPRWDGPTPEVRDGERVLVLGTGEFTWLPFRLAERLEAAGADVWFQTTTRSPVLLGHDIESCVSFPDNYCDGISNFLYNFTLGQYDRVILCHETPGALLPPEILAALGATPLEM